MDILYYKIIRTLIELHDYITAKELSEIIGISSSTVKHNLNNVKEELSKFGVYLLIHQRRGMYLVATEEERERILKKIDKQYYQTSDSYRKNYILDILLNYKTNYTIQLFTEELYISRNTLLKELNDIEKMLSRYHLNLIKKRNSGIVIEGNEFFIRQMIILNNNNKSWEKDYYDLPVGTDYRISRRAYTFFKITYPKINIEVIQKQLQDAEERLDLTFADISFCRLIEYIEITTRRIRQGSIITNLTSNNLIEVDSKYMKVSEIILKEVLGQDEIKCLFEIQYLAAMMKASKICEDYKLENYEPFKNEALKFAIKIGQVVSNKNIAKQSEFIHYLSATFERIKFRESYEIISWDDLHLDVQEKLSGLYAICMANLNEVENNLSIVFKPDDIAWVTLLLRNAINDSKTKAILITATDQHISKYQEHKIEEGVDGIKIIRNIHYSKFNNTTYKDKNIIIISTVPLQINSAKYIEVTKHIWESDIEKIKQCLKELHEKSETLNFEDCFNRVFSEDLVVDINASDKSEVIREGSRLLLEKNYVTEKFESKIWDREYVRPTYIGKGIAIPHVFKEGVKKAGVVIIKLKHPIDWSKEEKVRLIFLMAIDFDRQKEISEFFAGLYDFISNSKKIDKLLQTEDKKEILEILS